MWSVHELHMALNEPEARQPEFLAISHCWLSREHPDPEGSKLRQLGFFLRKLQQSTCASIAVFLDWCSLYQKRVHRSAGKLERLPQERECFARSLEQSHFWYAHECINTWCLTQVPDGMRSFDDRGRTTWEVIVGSMLTGCSTKYAHVLTELKARKAFVLDVNQISPGECEHLRYGELVERCKIIRRPPLMPDAFAELIAGKFFTCGKNDRPLIKRMYLKVFKEIYGTVKRLNFRSLPWRDAELLELCTVIPHCHKLEVLELSLEQVTSRSTLEAFRQVRRPNPYRPWTLGLAFRGCPVHDVMESLDTIFSMSELQYAYRAWESCKSEVPLGPRPVGNTDFL